MPRIQLTRPPAGKTMRDGKRPESPANLEISQLNKLPINLLFLTTPF
ncbi:hypothetical protein HQ447_00225 [bacterium]|nr:hypothetical protein [bacterium]